MRTVNKQTNIPAVPSTLEEAIKLAFALRSKAEQCEKTFILYLRALEESELWRPQAGGDGTYAHFLKRYKICEAHRYTSGLSAYVAMSELGDELGLRRDEIVDTIGMTAGKLLTNRIQDPSARKEAAVRMLEVAKNEGPLPRQTAYGHVDKVIREYGLHKPRLAVTEVERLRARVAELEEINRALRVENSELKRKLKLKRAA